MIEEDDEKEELEEEEVDSDVFPSMMIITLFSAGVPSAQQHSKPDQSGQHLSHPSACRPCPGCSASPHSSSAWVSGAAACRYEGYSIFIDIIEISLGIIYISTHLWLVSRVLALPDRVDSSLVLLFRLNLTPFLPKLDRASFFRWLSLSD